MNTSRFFLAAILSLSALASAASLLALGASPQATNSQAALVKQSNITFVGTVSQVAATSFAGVPKSAQTIVVRVDSVLKKPAAVSLKKGDTVTVEVKDPAAFPEGMQATTLPQVRQTLARRRSNRFHRKSVTRICSA